jgi:integration host factor subunit beta
MTARAPPVANTATARTINKGFFMANLATAGPRASLPSRNRPPNLRRFSGQIKTTEDSRCELSLYDHCATSDERPVVIKSLLVLRIAGQNPFLYQRDVEKAVDAIFDEIVSAMARRERVELRGFGTFVVKVRPAHVARNPKTGTAVEVSEKVTPAFKSAKEMRGRLNHGVADAAQPDS